MRIYLHLYHLPTYYLYLYTLYVSEINANNEKEWKKEGTSIFFILQSTHSVKWLSVI